MIPFLSRLYERYRNTDWFWIVLIIIACFLVMLPMPLSGMPEGYDVPQHLRFAAAFRDAFLTGSFVPGWVGADNYGFGAVGIRFYPPLADYVMGLTDIFFHGWYSSFIFNAFFWMFPGCIGMYFWAKEFLSREQAAFAATLFAVMPYHVLQIYQYTLFSEFAAASILPFCFWFVTRVITRGRPADILLLAVSYSLLVLTHLPTIITGSMALAVYTAFLLDWKKLKETAPRLLASACLSLSATSFYWLRLVTELDWLKHNTQENWSKFFDYSQYLFPIFYNSSEHVYWERIFWLLDITSLLTFILFLPLLICVVLKIRGTSSGGAQKRFFLALSATGLFLIFLMSSPGKFIWETLPVLHKIQFPWRFLSPTSIIAALSFSISLPLLYRQYPKAKRLIGYSAIALVFGVLLFDISENIAPMAPYSREAFESKYADMDNNEACDCWWPVWGNRNAFAQKEKVVAGSRIVSITAWEREDRKFIVAEGEAENARIATFWYPHWRAEINGASVEVGRDENGAILVPLPATRSDVRLHFQEPYFLEIAKIVSFLTWLGIFTTLLVFTWRKRRLRIELVSME